MKDWPLLLLSFSSICLLSSASFLGGMSCNCPTAAPVCPPTPACPVSAPVQPPLPSPSGGSRSNLCALCGSSPGNTGSSGGCGSGTPTEGCNDFGGNQGGQPCGSGNVGPELGCQESAPPHPIVRPVAPLTGTRLEVPPAAIPNERGYATGGHAAGDLLQEVQDYDPEIDGHDHVQAESDPNEIEAKEFFEQTDLATNAPEEPVSEVSEDLLSETTELLTTTTEAPIETTQLPENTEHPSGIHEVQNAPEEEGVSEELHDIMEVDNDKEFAANFNQSLAGHNFVSTHKEEDCNSEELGKIILENIDEDLNSAKRLIQLEAEEKLGGNFNVICASNDFTYLVNTVLFCQRNAGPVSCYAFRQVEA